MCFFYCYLVIYYKRGSNTRNKLCKIKINSTTEIPVNSECYLRGSMWGVGRRSQPSPTLPNPNCIEEGAQLVSTLACSSERVRPLCK